jgi:hypothetical protein
MVASSLSKALLSWFSATPSCQVHRKMLAESILIKKMLMMDGTSGIGPIKIFGEIDMLASQYVHLVIKGAI